MIEMSCPFCDEPCRMELAAFRADLATFRCAACDVFVDLDPREAALVPLAA